MGSGNRRIGQKSYAILRYTDKIMEHLQICSMCSEMVLGHMDGKLDAIKPLKRVDTDE